MTLKLRQPGGRGGIHMDVTVILHLAEVDLGFHSHKEALELAAELMTAAEELVRFGTEGTT
jgi:hypothetical protein